MEANQALALTVPKINNTETPGCPSIDWRPPDRGRRRFDVWPRRGEQEGHLILADERHRLYTRVIHDPPRIDRQRFLPLRLRTAHQPNEAEDALDHP